MLRQILVIGTSFIWLSNGFSLMWPITSMVLNTQERSTATGTIIQI